MHMITFNVGVISQDYGLAFHITYVVCVNFIREGRDSNFWETCLWQVYLLSEVLPEICFFHISFWYLIWDMNPSFTSNKPTHLLDYGYFNRPGYLVAEFQNCWLGLLSNQYCFWICHDSRLNGIGAPTLMRIRCTSEQITFWMTEYFKI